MPPSQRGDRVIDPASSRHPPKTVTFGEILLRLSPPGFERLFQSPLLKATFGGAEANVAVSLAHFGLDSHMVSWVPDNAVGKAAVRALRAEGVETRFVRSGGQRLGIYFAELGAGHRPLEVIYDRQGTFFQSHRASLIKWPAIFDGCSWFHCTGITPALGRHARATTGRALAAAKAHGVTVSFDLNYRQQLWSPEEAQAALRPLVHEVDLLIANADSLRRGLGIELVDEGEELDGATYREATRQVAEVFSCRWVVLTRLRQRSAGEHRWQATIFERASGKFFSTRPVTVPLIDRIGTGDSLAAGLIFAFLDGRQLAEALRFAVAASVLKPTIPGDCNRVSAAEVERLLADGPTGPAVLVDRWPPSRRGAS